MNASLLATKLHIPVVSTKLVARLRLLARLDDGLTRSLTLISAPPGFGKTTLVSEWIKSREISSAWLSLDEDDNNLNRFLTYAIAALATLKPGIGDEALILLQAPQPPPLKTIVISLINDLETISAPFALVLDDYHVISAQAIHEAISYLLDHQPQQMRLIILTRADPPQSLARLRARDQLVELRANDLRFTQDEASDFLKQVMGLNLSADEIATLEARTEGWIAGLQIAALSMRGQDGLAGFIKAFTGSNRFILDYLAEEVFQRQSKSIQDFLLRTAILDRMTGALCDAVTEQSDGAHILESLERGNLFIVPLDGERRWYRYHHLFADLLRFRLNRDSLQLVPELHRRAARWLESQDGVFDALKQWLAARDFAQAIRLLESIGLGMLERGAVPQLLGWIKQIPAEHIRTSSWLNIYHAWALLLTGQFGELETRLVSVERELDDPERQSKLGHIVTIRAYVAVMSEDVPRTLQLAQQARELLPPHALSIQSIVAFILGGANLLAQDLAGAEKYFADAAKWGE
jgi:LuxR family maltose regulon positive regulatory protein